MIDPIELTIADHLDAARQALALDRRTLVDFQVQAALALRPGHPAASRMLEDLRARVGPLGPALKPKCTRFLLIKAWGQGFWSEMNNVLGCLLLAELTGRMPVIHWGPVCLFGDGAGNAFTHFWEPFSEFTLKDLVALGPVPTWPPKWNNANLGQDQCSMWDGPHSRIGGTDILGREETLAVCDFYVGVVDMIPWIPQNHPYFGLSISAVSHHVANRWLRPRADIRQAASEARARIGPGPVVAVHMRGSDKHTELTDINQLNKMYADVMDTIAPEVKLFVMTDDDRWLAAIKTRYGARVFHTDSYRSNTEQGPHLTPGLDKVALGREMMIDTHVALMCDAFIGNGASNVSCSIAFLKSWPKGACSLMMKPITDQRNLFIHTTRTV